MAKSLTPIKAIRLHCLDCQAGSKKQVRLCPDQDCQFYPYRMGKNPKCKNIGGNPSFKLSEPLT